MVAVAVTTSTLEEVEGNGVEEAGIDFDGAALVGEVAVVVVVATLSGAAGSPEPPVVRARTSSGSVPCTNG